MQQIGAYQLVRELARGGMGVVYLAQGPKGEQVAIKLLLPGARTDVELLRRFQREGKALETLDHPGILRVREVGVDRAQPYMVMDLLSGPTLADVVRTEGPLPEARVRRLGQRMAAALAHAHSRGIVHRDVKPDNVILRGDDPVLVDFGLIRLLRLDVSRLTETGTIMGSPAYMAPEQADGSANVGPAADLYGLGVTLYCLLTGQDPFKGKGVIAVIEQVLTTEPPAPSSLREGLDGGLEQVILRCMAKLPSERFPTAVALEQALAKLAHPVRGNARAQRLPKPRTSALALGFALLALLSAIAALLVGLWFGVFAGEQRAGQLEPASPAPASDLEPASPAPAGDPEPASPDPRDVSAYVSQGKNKASHGLYAEAIEDFDQALRLDPQNAKALANRGESRERLERHAEAIEDFDKVLELDPQNAKALDNRGVSKARLGRTNEALGDLNRALELDPRSASTWANRGVAKAKLGRYAEAIDDFDKSLELEPRKARAWASRGESKAMLGRHAEAIDDFDKVLELDPQNATAWTYRGESKASLGRHAEAIEDYDQALRLDPRDAWTYFCRGVIKADLARYAEAIEDYGKAIELGPRSSRFWSNRGESKASLGRHAEAIDDYDRALELEPRTAQVWANRGFSKAGLQRYSEAIDDFDRALELDPRSASTYAYRGASKASLGRYVAAIEDYDKALKTGVPAKLLEGVRRAREEAAAKLAAE